MNNMQFIKVLKVVVLYVVLIGGGIWHVLDKFQDLMQLFAAPVIIFLGIWLFFENLTTFTDPSKSVLLRYVFLSLFVFAFSLLVESLGVNTGLIFGKYHYGDNLSPYIIGVPLSIGFAWLTMLLAAGSVVHFLFFRISQQNEIIGALLIAFFMMLFDIFMEPAAMKLGYWTWNNAEIPVQNYIAWFVIGFFFAYVGFKLKIFSQKFSSLGVHVYLAQIIYFILVYFS
jgi:putative membrane protein